MPPTEVTFALSPRYGIYTAREAHDWFLGLMRESEKFEVETDRAGEPPMPFWSETVLGLLIGAAVGTQVLVPAHGSAQNFLSVSCAAVNFRSPLSDVLFCALCEQAFAQHILGLWYDTGDYGLTEDDEEAVRWYRLAAEQGWVNARQPKDLCGRSGQLATTETQGARRLGDVEGKPVHRYLPDRCEQQLAEVRETVERIAWILWGASIASDVLSPPDRPTRAASHAYAIGRIENFGFTLPD